jgi:MFS family permease
MMAGAGDDGSMPLDVPVSRTAQTPAGSTGSAAGTRRGGGWAQLPAGSGFWAIAVVFAVAMAFSTVPAPLYAFYRQRDGFSTFMITVVFAAYAVGVIGSLFLAGHISDWFGRRKLLLAALATEAVAGVLFLVWKELPGLIVARVVTGIGVGLVTATATAHLGELHLLARPGAPRTRADRASVAANMGGLALGPLIAGFLAEYVFHPLVVPYVLFLVLLAGSAVAVAFVPETVDLDAERPRYRPQRVSVPPAGRPLYFTVAVASFVAFSILGLFTSVSAGFISGTLHHSSPLLAGAVTFGVFGAGALAQIASSGLPAGRQVRLGLAAMALGVLIVTGGVWEANLAGFVIGGLVAGSGVGVLFKGALATVLGLAPDHAKGEALAGLFLAAYTGLVIPVVGVGLATLSVSLKTALLGFAIAVLVVTAGVTMRLLALARA